MISNRLLLIKLEIADDVGRIITTLIIGFMVSLFAFMGLLFASALLGQWLNTLLHSSYLGFAIVAATYFLMVPIILFGLRKSIGARIEQVVLRSFFNSNQNTTDPSRTQTTVES